MTFFKVWRCDLKNGFVREYKKFLWAFIIFIVMCFDFYLRAPSLRELMFGAETTFGDYLTFTFLGISEYRPGGAEPFRFPQVWMLIFLLILYIVLYYPYKDLMGFGRQVLMNSHSRFMWWMSKVLWLVATVGSYFLLFYAVFYIFCQLAGVSMSLRVSEYLIFQYVPPTHVQPEVGSFLTVELLVMPFLLTVALGLLQMTLSLIIRPFFSYCVSIAVLLVSAYYLNPFMLGNYTMMVRSSKIVTNGVHWETGLLYIGLLIVISFVSGLLIFRRYDILNKDA